jgi:glycosyltransferase involved in cell wall biosynthesis
MRLVYVSGGGADIISAHRRWMQGIPDESQVSLTFSGQVASFVREAGIEALFVSFSNRIDTLNDGSIRLVHLGQKDRSGLGYHAEAVRKAWQVLKLTRAYKADVILVDSGSLPFFMLAMFSLYGIRVVPILHNTLWAAGNPPTSRKAQAIAAIDRLFWRGARGPALAVSAEAERQIVAVTGGNMAVHRFLPMFRREYFDGIEPVDTRADPFTVMFVGRAVSEKGIFLVLDAAVILANEGLAIRWIICGDGDDLPALRAAVDAAQMQDAFDIRGWTSPAALREIYPSVHAVIVPTTTRFSEGFAMTAAEAVLAGRPFVSNSVVPALEMLAPAAVEAKPDDAKSHAEAVAILVRDTAAYRSRQEACAQLGSAFYNRDNGLTAALHRALADLL